MSKFFSLGLFLSLSFALVACGGNSKVSRQADSLNTENRELADWLRAAGTPRFDWSEETLVVYEQKLNRFEVVNQSMKRLTTKNSGLYMKGSSNAEFIAATRARINAIRGLQANFIEQRPPNKLLKRSNLTDEDETGAGTAEYNELEFEGSVDQPAEKSI